MQSFAQSQLKADHAQALWQSMLREVARRGLDTPAPGIARARWIMLSFSLGITVLGAWTAAGTVGLIAFCIGLAFLIAQFAFMGHDAGHGAISRSAGWTQFLGQSCMTVVTGLCFDEWYQRHRTHHQFCQFEAKDPDMDVALVVSLTAAAREHKTPAGRFFTRIQGVSVWFLAFFFAQSQRHLSQWGVIREPRRFRLDALVLLLHFALWWGLPLLVLNISPIRVLLVYTLPLFFLGPYLAAIFWVNHVGMPLMKNPEDFSFLEHQATTSRTILNPRSMDWFFGGLNYQIEHHLYPQIPSFRLRSVQTIVQPAFHEAKIPYNGVGFAEAVKEIARHFRSIARGY